MHWWLIRIACEQKIHAIYDLWPGVNSQQIMMLSALRATVLPWEGNFHSHRISVGIPMGNHMWIPIWISIWGSPQGKIKFLFSSQFHGYGDPYGDTSMDPHTHGIVLRIGIWLSPVGIPIWISMWISIWGYPYGDIHMGISIWGYPYGDIHMGIPTGKNHIPIPFPWVWGFRYPGHPGVRGSDEGWAV